MNENEKDFDEQISATGNTLSPEYNRLSKLVSQADIDMQGILQKFEFEEINEEEAYECALQIKKIRQKRRIYTKNIEILINKQREKQANHIESKPKRNPTLEEKMRILETLNQIKKKMNSDDECF